MSDDFRPRRSCLYMPASNERALEKAQSLPADCLIFDLEDAVAPEAKEEARRNAYEAAGNEKYGRRERVVRINGADTSWFGSDMEKICASGAHAILVPKVTSASDITMLSHAMDNYDARKSMELWVMIEMPLAILNLAEIAAAAKKTRLTTFACGFNDLAKEMEAGHDRGIFGPVMVQIIMAARAHGLHILDSVYNDFSDAEGLEWECRQAKNIGFDGKTLIHPSQIDIANTAFAPSAEKIAEAKAIIAAFAEPANAGKGAITMDGKMVELLHLKQAEHTIAVAEEISATGQ